MKKIVKILASSEQLPFYSFLLNPGPEMEKSAMQRKED